MNPQNPGKLSTAIGFWIIQNVFFNLAPYKNVKNFMDR
jgi:hypothetical protein